MCSYFGLIFVFGCVNYLLKHTVLFLSSSLFFVCVCMPPILHLRSFAFSLAFVVYAREVEQKDSEKYTRYLTKERAVEVLLACMLLVLCARSCCLLWRTKQSRCCSPDTRGSERSRAEQQPPTLATLAASHFASLSRSMQSRRSIHTHTHIRFASLIDSVRTSSNQEIPHAGNTPTRRAESSSP